MKKVLSILYFLVYFPLSGIGKTPDEVFERLLFHRAQEALTRIIVGDIFSPPVASRIYVYAHVSAYETLLLFRPGTYQSLAGQLRDLPPSPLMAISGAKPGLAATEALLGVGRSLVFSEQLLDQESQRLWDQARRHGYSAATIEQSRNVGQQMAKHIMNWAAKDQYKQTRSLRRYTPLKKEGSWLPTPPGYMTAVEPYWGRIRTLTLDSSAQFQLPAPPAYSIQSGSAFYNSAKEVLESGTKLTNEQRLIANYWDCNPFFLHTQGHMNFGSKKLSPNGHWMSIVGQVARQTNASIYKTSAAYVLSAIAMFDGFISCWKDKYTFNVIRPETYINAHITESWKPILQTPPFPEYPSGHSVISSAAAVVLTDFFGKNVAFTDSTEMPYGLPSRKFKSFHQAAEEAAISRLYGGIHYREAIENGQKQGLAVGEQVLSKVRVMKAGK